MDFSDLNYHFIFIINNDERFLLQFVNLLLLVFTCFCTIDIDGECEALCECLFTRICIEICASGCGVEANPMIH